jgi:hypothetical protein
MCAAARELLPTLYRAPSRSFEIAITAVLFMLL